MTIDEMLTDLATNPPNREGIEFAGLQIRIGRHDELAARLLLYMQEMLLDKTVDTVGDIDDILDAAKWWHMLLSSMYIKKDTTP